MKRAILALSLSLMLMLGLAACDGNVMNPAGTSTPLVTEDVRPGENTQPGSGVPTTPPASPTAPTEGSPTVSPEGSPRVS